MRHAIQVLCSSWIHTSIILWTIGTLISCSGGSGDGAAPTTDPSQGSDTNLPSGTTLEAWLAECPQASTLIETTEWMSCLEGKVLSGTEHFTNKACSLFIKAQAAMDYSISDNVVISVPERSQWKSATGTYLNDATSGPRYFLAGLAPDLPAVADVARVTNIDIALFALSSQQDTLAVRYLDANLARQTHNCTIKAL